MFTSTFFTVDAHPPHSPIATITPQKTIRFMSIPSKEQEEINTAPRRAEIAAP
ncbi:MAG: hypothetical protein NTV49_07485 [Kiritimatiellaeota bacterium]|nr:hypothetical protein [Kiritimatiellota bacterium]